MGFVFQKRRDRDVSFFTLPLKVHNRNFLKKRKKKGRKKKKYPQSEISTQCPQLLVRAAHQRVHGVTHLLPMAVGKELR